MCAKREHEAVLQPIAKLHEEFIAEGMFDVLPDLAYAGARVYFGTLENV